MQKQNRQTCDAIVGLIEYNQAFKNAVKPCLLRNSKNYCSYCDSFHWNAGDLIIEHFKNRHKFSELETDYSNLYAACWSCNNRKRDENYPAINPLRPDSRDYNFDKYFYFEADTGKILLLDENDIVSKETLHFLNLNNPDLKKARKDFFQTWFENQERPGNSFRFIEFET